MILNRDPGEELIYQHRALLGGIWVLVCKLGVSTSEQVVAGRCQEMSENDGVPTSLVESWDIMARQSWLPLSGRVDLKPKAE